ncbi:YdcF family protein [Dactylosporangium matsuzakiense]|uniref:DUF218 domain-containing protein n=1 Tax=Dactylosporangium matsuzakiense TaxID=53360 RepID=A0A9W6KNL2_9ACTN|nr:YdcF family protein [Dactylosporangium matsuzakiense]UWZ48032.1 hypothetical protein Dmats_17510 [Dactylosporangium matsuzakiense]GLL03515.1 hypothetical protein GCM10017581_052610 [Dactylosporangium matsuzakiense]
MTGYVATLLVFGRGVHVHQGRSELTADSLARVHAAVEHVLRMGRPARIVFTGGWAGVSENAPEPPPGHREADLMLREAARLLHTAAAPRTNEHRPHTPNEHDTRTPNEHSTRIRRTDVPGIDTSRTNVHGTHPSRADVHAANTAWHGAHTVSGNAGAADATPGGADRGNRELGVVGAMSWAGAGGGRVGLVAECELVAGCELVAEVRSRSTLENLLNLVEEGLVGGPYSAAAPLGLVSHAWHLPRVRYLAGKVLGLRGTALVDIPAAGPWQSERLLRLGSRLCLLGARTDAALRRRERIAVALVRRAGGGSRRAAGIDGG